MVNHKNRYDNRRFQSIIERVKVKVVYLNFILFSRTKRFTRIVKIKSHLTKYAGNRIEHY